MDWLKVNKSLSQTFVRSRHRVTVYIRNPLVHLGGDRQYYTSGVDILSPKPIAQVKVCPLLSAFVCFPIAVGRNCVRHNTQIHCRAEEIKGR